jgi:hypothetical protein
VAMLRALACAKYSNFTLYLMHTEKLTLTYAKVAFHIEEIERNTVHGPLIAPAGNAALFTSLLSNSSKASTSKNPLCIVCGQGNYPLEMCFDLIKAKELCVAVSEHGTMNIGLWTCEYGLMLCFFDAIF